MEYWKDFIENDLDELCEFCQDYYRYVKPSFDNEKAAGIDRSNYATQVVRASDWIRQRANFIYSKLMIDYGLVGDANVDGVVSIADVTTLISYLLQGDEVVINRISADVNGDGILNIGDVTAMISLLLSM